MHGGCRHYVDQLPWRTFIPSSKYESWFSEKLFVDHSLVLFAFGINIMQHWAGAVITISLTDLLPDAI